MKVNWCHILTQSSLNGDRSVARTVISVHFLKRWYQTEIPIPRDNVRFNWSLIFG